MNYSYLIEKWLIFIQIVVELFIIDWIDHEVIKLDQKRLIFGQIVREWFTNTLCELIVHEWFIIDEIVYELLMFY